MWPIRICTPFVNQFCVNSPPLLQIKQPFLPGKSLRSSIFIGTMTAAATSADTSLARIAPIEAVLFDVDGTLCDTDPIHHRAFIELLQEINYNNGVPISEDFYINNIAGKHNKEIAELFFPGDIPRGIKFTDDKEALFRKLAAEHIKALDGLYKVTKWVEDRGLKRAAVTNAPKLNAELAISKLGLSDFFQAVILGDECEHAKPHPEPYQKALEVLQVSKDHTFVFEDSVSGIRAGVAAGMPVIGLTTGNPEHLLMKANPTFLIKNYDDPKLWAALEEVDRASGKQPSG
ncbi:Haloacid dehalogenase-like hydrolase domain-containing protein Sgpp [Linum perenne]